MLTILVPLISGKSNFVVTRSWLQNTAPFSPKYFQHLMSATRTIRSVNYESEWSKVVEKNRETNEMRRKHNTCISLLQISVGMLGTKLFWHPFYTRSLIPRCLPPPPLFTKHTQAVYISSKQERNNEEVNGKFRGARQRWHLQTSCSLFSFRGGASPGRILRILQLTMSKTINILAKVVLKTCI